MDGFSWSASVFGPSKSRICKAQNDFKTFLSMNSKIETYKITFWPCKVKPIIKNHKIWELLLFPFLKACMTYLTPSDQRNWCAQQTCMSTSLFTAFPSAHFSFALASPGNSNQDSVTSSPFVSFPPPFSNHISSNTLINSLKTDPSRQNIKQNQICLPRIFPTLNLYLCFFRSSLYCLMTDSTCKERQIKVSKA